MRESWDLLLGDGARMVVWLWLGVEGLFFARKGESRRLVVRSAFAVAVAVGLAFAFVFALGAGGVTTFGLTGLARAGDCACE